MDLKAISGYDSIIRTQRLAEIVAVASVAGYMQALTAVITVYQYSSCAYYVLCNVFMQYHAHIITQ